MIDTTCPLVRRAHELAKNFQRLGYFVVVVGKKDHVEVKSLVGDLENFAVVECPEEVRIYQADKIGVLCQTTTSLELLERVYLKIVRKNFGKEIRFVNTICRPTRDRQKAVEVYWKKSRPWLWWEVAIPTTHQQLAALAGKKGIPCLLVEKAQELQKEWFEGFSIIGLTAGASTLQETIEEVYRRLSSLN